MFQPAYNLICNFKYIIYLYSQKKLMWKRLSLQDHYAQWLNTRHIHQQQNIIINFKVIVENFISPHMKIDNKGIYLTNHAQFLIQMLTQKQNQIRGCFHLLILMLNFILKIQPSIKIAVKMATLHAIKNYVLTNKHGLESAHITSSILWLICRSLHGANNKRAILVELDKSQVITSILKQAQLDELGQKAMSMLLYFISRNKVETGQFAINILQNSHKFDHPEAIKHVTAIIKDVGLSFYQNNRNVIILLANFLVHNIQHLNLTIYNQIDNIQLILLAATHHPHLIPQLKIFQFIQNKLSLQTIQHQPLLQKITKLVQLQRWEESVVKRYLDLAVLTLSNNVVSRRLFILFHQNLTQQQLLMMLSNNVISSLSRHIDSHNQIQNALKLMICLKLSVRRLGLDSIFWYACKSLIKRILEYRSSSPRSQQKELFELFEQTLKEQLNFIKYI